MISLFIIMAITSVVIGVEVWAIQKRNQELIALNACAENLIIRNEHHKAFIINAVKKAYEVKNPFALIKTFIKFPFTKIKQKQENKFFEVLDRIHEDNKSEFPKFMTHLGTATFLQFPTLYVLFFAWLFVFVVVYMLLAVMFKIGLNITNIAGYNAQEVIVLSQQKFG